MMVIIIILYSIALGILVNGLADNLPELKDAILPEDTLPRCAYCGGTRTWSDISSLGSIFLRGDACARCSAPRRLRDLLVESALGIVLPALWIGGLRPPIDFLTGSLILATFILMTVIDFEHRYVLSGILICFSLLFIGLTVVKGFSGISWILMGGISGLGILFFCYILGWVLARVFKMGDGVEPLGFGDVWLGGAVGMVTGWPAIVPAVFLAILLAGVYGLCVLLVHVLQRKPARNVTIAYGPFLMLSGILFHFSAGPLAEGIITLLQ
jgi:prepilin signal peptidase PulO-like enzyme (type II secretory pathway)